MTINSADLQQAIACHQQGRLDEAVEGYRQVLQVDPGHWNTRYLLGTALLQSGEFRECVNLLSSVVHERPDADAQNNLGVAYKALGEWEQAARAFEAVVRSHPDYDQAYFNLGTLMADRGLHKDAEKCFRHGLTLNPSDQQTRFHLAQSLVAQSNWAEAELLLREILAADESHAEAGMSLAYVLARTEQLDEAVAVYEQLLESDPDDANVHSSLSFVFERMGRLEEATQAAQRAVELDPNLADSFNNLGVALRSQHDLAAAEDAFRKAMQLRDDFPLAEFNLGATLLMRENYADGWKHYARYRDLFAEPRREFGKPQWDGAKISGRRLLIHADQGFGDAIQFARFLLVAQQRSEASIVLVCPKPLKQLLSGMEGVELVLDEDEPLPEFDLQASLTQLPIVLQADADSIGVAGGYLKAPPIRAELRNLLESIPAGKRKIGIVWQGNPAQARDALRSCPMELLKPLADLKDATLISLQTEPEVIEQSRLLSDMVPMVDVGSQLRDFADTASVLAELDVLITVDTAIAHLAGALGLNPWVMLCHTPDWRWQLEGSDSTWYPGARLFRQARPHDWNSVLASIVQASDG